MTLEKWVSYLNDNVDLRLLKLSFLNNNGKIEWMKYLYLNDIGDFGFPLLALLTLSPMSFKKGPKKWYVPFDTDGNCSFEIVRWIITLNVESHDMKCS